MDALINLDVAAEVRLRSNTSLLEALGPADGIWRLRWNDGGGGGGAARVVWVGRRCYGGDVEGRGCGVTPGRRSVGGGLARCWIAGRGGGDGRRIAGGRSRVVARRWVGIGWSAGAVRWNTGGGNGDEAEDSGGFGHYYCCVTSDNKYNECGINECGWNKGTGGRTMREGRGMVELLNQAQEDRSMTRPVLGPPTASQDSSTDEAALLFKHRLAARGTRRGSIVTILSGHLEG